MYLDNCIDDINNHSCLFEENKLNNILNNLDYQFSIWEETELQHKKYLRYIGNPQRAIIPYQDYNTVKLLMICINIFQICFINFVIIPSKIVVICKNI